ncbi:hypothetical protein BVI1335_70177 [Burkholderia vietnamiensis]|nr:hypothetical protein BVI1335_70177 [Burkholderia vietnamiensis]
MIWSRTWLLNLTLVDIAIPGNWLTQKKKHYTNKYSARS